MSAWTEWSMRWGGIPWGRASSGCDLNGVGPSHSERAVCFSQLIIPLSDDFSKYNDSVGLWESKAQLLPWSC